MATKSDRGARIADALLRAAPYIFVTSLLGGVAAFLFWAAHESAASWRAEVTTLEESCSDPRAEAIARALIAVGHLPGDDGLVIVHNGKLESLTAHRLLDRSLAVTDREGNIVCFTPGQTG